MPLSAEDIKNLHKYEVRILRALERMMHRYAWVPEDDLKAAVHLLAAETTDPVGNPIHSDLVRDDAVRYKAYALVF